MPCATGALGGRFRDEGRLPRPEEAGLGSLLMGRVEAGLWAGDEFHEGARVFGVVRGEEQAAFREGGSWTEFWPVLSRFP